MTMLAKDFKSFYGNKCDICDKPVEDGSLDAAIKDLGSGNIALVCKPCSPKETSE